LFQQVEPAGRGRSQHQGWDWHLWDVGADRLDAIGYLKRKVIRPLVRS
jgi:hypothetical protein